MSGSRCWVRVSKRFMAGSGGSGWRDGRRGLHGIGVRPAPATGGRRSNFGPGRPRLRDEGMAGGWRSGPPPGRKDQPRPAGARGARPDGPGSPRAAPFRQGSTLHSPAAGDEGIAAPVGGLQPVARIAAGPDGRGGRVAGDLVRPAPVERPENGGCIRVRTGGIGGTGRRSGGARRSNLSRMRARGPWAAPSRRRGRAGQNTRRHPLRRSAGRAADRGRQAGRDAPPCRETGHAIGARSRIRGRPGHGSRCCRDGGMEALGAAPDLPPG